jgi:hypothetical protein
MTGLSAEFPIPSTLRDYRNKRKMVDSRSPGHLERFLGAVVIDRPALLRTSCAAVTTR